MQNSPADFIRLAIENARCAEVDSAMLAVLDAGAAQLFETVVLEPGELLCGFDEAPGCCLIVSGHVRLERRTDLGRTVASITLGSGKVFGRFPGAHTREWPPLLVYSCRAIDRVQLVRLPPEQFPALLARAPGVVPHFDYLDALIRSGDNVAQTMHRTPGFAAATPHSMSEMADAATPLRVTETTMVRTLGVVPESVLVVLDGAVYIEQLDPQGKKTVHRAELGTSLNVAECALQKPALDSVRAEPGALFAEISRVSLARLIASTPSVRRGLLHSIPQNIVDVMLLQSDIPEAPLHEITCVLAGAIRFVGDTSAVLTLVKENAAPPRFGPGGQLFLEIAAATPADVLPNILATMAKAGPSAPYIEYIFVSPKAPSQAHLHALVPMLSRLLWFTSNPASRPPEPFRACRVDMAAQLGPTGSARPPLWPPGVPRMRLDWAEVSRVQREGPAAAGTPTFSGLSRWSRAISGRLVGLALGGGGSPGFSHVALIRSLEAAGIPIDMVSGTSFGALVGAWYAGVMQTRRAEPKRLQSLVDSGVALNRCMAWGLINHRPLANTIDQEFGGLLLGDLEVPFLPVATEVDTGTTYVGHSESLGQSVRISGAFPGLFPTVAKDQRTRLVDGGFVNNVPSSVLKEEGAAYVLASNSIGLIPPRKPNPVPGKLGKALGELNVVGRVEDLIRAALLLFHRMGDSESLGAEYVFESRYTGLQFWDFSRGEAVIAATQPSADAFVGHLQAVLARNRMLRTTK